MTAIYLLIIASLLVALGFLAAFLWAIKNGQYEDDYSPSIRMLSESEELEELEINTTNDDRASN